MTTTTVKSDHRGDACRTVLLSFYSAVDDKHNLMIHYYYIVVVVIIIYIVMQWYNCTYNIVTHTIVFDAPPVVWPIVNGLVNNIITNKKNRYYIISLIICCGIYCKPLKNITSPLKST